jgi:hypothetical protein
MRSKLADNSVDYEHEHDYPASLKLRRAGEHDKRRELTVIARNAVTKQSH